MRIDYGQGEKEVVASIYTLTIYEQEFKSDLIADFFGDQTVRKSDLEMEDEDVVVTFRFSDTRFAQVPKVLWACLKAADEFGIPSYKEWAKSVTDVDLFDLNNEVAALVGRAFFRAGVADLEENGEGEQEE